MPARALDEALRVLKAGGCSLIADYGRNPKSHILHRFPPFRAVLERLEPFLGDFWRSDLHALAMQSAARYGMQLNACPEAPVFGGFCRVLAFSAH